LCKGGELFDKMDQLKSFDEGRIAQIIKQILVALNYFHQLNIVHRDLKLANIMLYSSDLENLELKIADFGFATFFDPAEGLDFQLGSPFFMAPEVLNGQMYSEKIDVWSVGIITHVLLTGEKPFGGDTISQITQSVISK